MNYGMIVYILGTILKAEAILMSLPALVAFLCGEGDLVPMLAAILIASGAGLLFTFKKPKNTVIYAKEGFVVTALSWVAMSLVGALPFVFAGAIPSYIDAVFETVSGFTTTGASILTDVEGMSRGLLFWRSFTHWVGGMGVLVFLLAIVPLAGGRSVHIMRAESPGPVVGKLVPKVRDTAMILYGIYITMTVVLIALLLLGGMPLYDSAVHAFGTAGTGGFGIWGDSIAHYDSAYIDVVLSIGMVLFGVNFNIYYLLLMGKVKSILRSEELRWYLGIIAGATLLIAWNTLSRWGGILQSLRYAFFQVASVITTTGFATADFNLWPELSRMLLLVLMLVGACAGSTGGGMKVSRLIIMLKSAKREISRMLHPRSVYTLQFEGKPLEDQTIHNVFTYFFILVFLVIASVLLVSLDNMDFDSTFSAVLACINNIGPGLGIVGPMGSYAALSPLSKLVLILDMLLGRLEIFPMLMLFAPSVWIGKRRRG
ncbi:MAG: TrkH family potassium uptake protein [Angelakisella sp.]|jgi:trk system potassium uptake protein TrkH|nr:TrkH family potassium uptake protein [Angelakisella sp.]